MQKIKDNDLCDDEGDESPILLKHQFIVFEYNIRRIEDKAQLLFDTI